MIVLMAQIFLALVLVAVSMAIWDGCRKVLQHYRSTRRVADAPPPAGA